MPISKDERRFEKSDDLLKYIAKREYFAVRRGKLKFRGFVLRLEHYGEANLKDEHFEPRFEQKGVDMRIGLDIATLTADRIVECITLVTADTDFVAALKLARRNGAQIRLVALNGGRLSTELHGHADFVTPMDTTHPALEPRA